MGCCVPGPFGLAVVHGVDEAWEYWWENLARHTGVYREAGATASGGGGKVDFSRQGSGSGKNLGKQKHL